MGSLAVKSAVERKAWMSAMKQAVGSNAKFLTDIGSEQDDSQK